MGNTGSFWRLWEAWRCPANFGPDTDRGGLCWSATLDHRDYPDDHPWFADKITGNAIKMSRAADNAALVPFYDD